MPPHAVPDAHAAPDADPAPDAPPFCVRFGGALGLPLVMAGVIVLCIAAAILITIATSILAYVHLKPGAHDEIYAFSLICDFLALWLLMAPVFGYLRIGQVKKVDVIKGFYTPELISEYFDQFWSGRDSIAALVKQWRDHRPDQHDDLVKKLNDRFGSIIVEDFGGGVYVVPALILVAIGFIVLFFGFSGGIAYAEQLLVGSKGLPPVMPLGLRLDLVSVAAIFGAYTWVAGDSITRAHQWTFHPSDLFWYALRLLIAVPLGQAIAAAVASAPATSTTGATAAVTVTTGVGAFLAFVISMFSFDAIKKYLTAAATRLGNAPVGSPDERNDIVTKMAGVDEAAADALRAEGVSTIAQLTAVDPIRISILTGLPFAYVLRLIDSAILWTFFRDKTDQLREFGLRGASAMLAHAESPATDLALAAGKLTEVQAALRTCQQGVDAATANRDVAKVAVGADPMTLEAAEAALAQIKAEPDQAAAAERLQAMEAKVAALRQLRDRGGELNTKTASRDVASKAAADAATVLRTAAAKDALFEAIQTEVKINALGLSQAVAQLSTDDYAKFIRRLLGA
jgi:hypothetical protein